MPRLFRPHRRPTAALAGASLLAVLGACAYAKVVKIPHPSSYGYAPGSKEWRDVLEKGDRIEGTRFYLPRPFVIVKREFAVGGESFFVSGSYREGSLTIIGEVPADHAAAFPQRQVALGELRDPNGLTRDGDSKAGDEAALHRQSESPQNGGGSGSKPDRFISKDAYITVDSISPPSVEAKGQVVAFQVTVAKDPVDEGVDGTLKDELWIVPFKGAAPDTSAVTKAVFLRREPGASGKHVLKGQLSADELPAFYTLGVVVEKTTGEETERLLFHTSRHKGANPFAESDKPKDEPTKKPDQAAKKPLTSATLSTMGDPATSPYTKVGDLFDIALYPDFTEQYAMRTQGNLGYAKADLALENGWLVERVSMEMDNRELGLLIADTARKVVDAGLAAASPAAAAADLASAAPLADQLRLQSEAGDRPVTLRVDYVEYAIPGMHPLLKPEEYRDGDSAPRVGYQTRKAYVISLVELPRGDGGSPRTSTVTTGLTSEDVRNLTQQLANTQWDEVDGHGDVFKGDPGLAIAPPDSTTIRATRSTMLSLGTLPVEYLETQENDDVTDEQRAAFFGALTTRLRASSGIDRLKSIHPVPRRD